MTTRDGINLALKIIGLTGLEETIVVAPNDLQAINVLLRKKSNKTQNLPEDRILRELKRQCLVEISSLQDGQFSFALTLIGAKRLQQVIIDELTIPTPKKWDSKWRIVSFDIPVKSSKQRLYFTRHLRAMGFMMLQRSLWIHPFSCFDVIEQLAGYYNVLRYCSFFEVSKVDNLSARRLLRRFEPLLSHR